MGDPESTSAQRSEIRDQRAITRERASHWKRWRFGENIGKAVEILSLVKCVEVYIYLASSK